MVAHKSEIHLSGYPDKVADVSYEILEVKKDAQGKVIYAEQRFYNPNVPDDYWIKKYEILSNGNYKNSSGTVSKDNAPKFDSYSKEISKGEFNSFLNDLVLSANEIKINNKNFAPIEALHNLGYIASSEKKALNAVVIENLSLNDQIRYQKIVTSLAEPGNNLSDKIKLGDCCEESYIPPISDRLEELARKSHIKDKGRIIK